MSVPILRQGDVLIASVQSALTDVELRELREDLAGRIGTARARGVVVDVTVLDVLDSFATRTLRTLVETARLRGAEAIVVGIQPDVALSMVQLGLALDVPTALDLDDGLLVLEERAGAGSHGG